MAMMEIENVTASATCETLTGNKNNQELTENKNNQDLLATMIQNAVFTRFLTKSILSLSGTTAIKIL